MAVKRIILKGLYGVRDEGKAVAAITPGHLIEEVAAGVQVHSTAAANAMPMFALEREMTGDGIDVAYAANDTVLFVVAQPGAMINALVAAGAPAIAVGDALESAGDGTLRKAVTDAATDDTQRDAIVAYAREAVDNSGGGTAVRLKVRVA